MDAALAEVVQFAVLAMEFIGVAIILAGSLGALFGYAWRRFRQLAADLPELRAQIGRAILLGLELLVAADIINTVAIEPTMQSVLVLGGIVLIRTILSFSLEVEIEGCWPWERNKPLSVRSRD